MNKKDTKRALLVSFMAILMCVTMLIATTFAWFTDTASTAVNKIQAGNLKVDLEMNDGTDWVSAEGKTLSFKKAAGHENEQILWEPGCTYELPQLRVVNKGNLALKYKVVFSAINGDEDAMKLAEVLDVSLNGNKVGTLKDALTSTDPDGFAHGNLPAEGTSGGLKITVQMQTTAGNDYQGLSIGGIAVTLLATQDTVENDSFGNQYDKDAEYPAITVGTTLNDVFTDLTDKDGNGVDFGVNAPAKDVSVNGQGIATVTGFADAWFAGDVTIKGVKFLNGACFTAKEDGTVGTLTLEDCTFYACDQSKIDRTPYMYNSLKNSGDGLCLNVDTKDSPNLKVVIKNCRFIGENDPTLNRDGWKDIGGTNWDPNTAVKKSRGHAVMINGICGGGFNAKAESVLIEGCTMDGIRGHAIQLHSLRMGVTVKNCTINSWGNNAQTAAGTKSDAAIRGDIVNGSGGNLTVMNTRFGLNESTSLRHINVDNYSGNTNGSRPAGTY